MLEHGNGLSAEEKANVNMVLDFFAGLAGGTKRHVRDAYDRLMAENCVYENSGLPAFSKAETMQFFFSDVDSDAGIVKLVADMRHIMVRGSVVFTERVDHHYEKDGNDILTPEICGIFEFENGRCIRWADYFDPGPMHELFADIHPQPDPA